MTLNIEFHHDSIGSYEKHIAFPFEIDEIDVFDSTPEWCSPKDEIGEALGESLLDLIPYEDRDKWYVYLCFGKLLDWNNETRQHRQIDLHLGVWRYMKLHEWPEYLDDAVLGKEFFVGKNQEPILSNGKDTNFYGEEEEYYSCFALARMTIDSLLGLLQRKNISYWNNIFISREDYLSKEELLCHLIKSWDKGSYEFHCCIVKDGGIALRYVSNGGLVPYDEFCAIVSKDVLIIPTYKFPNADRSMFD